MWKACKLAVLFVLATVCHWGLATMFSYVGLNINFMLVFAIAFCTVARLEVGYPVAFLCGLFLDFFGAKLFGNNAFSFTVVACAVYALKERIDFEGVLPQVVTVFVLTCAVGIINSLLLIWFTASSMWPGTLHLLGSALVGAVLSPVVFAVLRICWYTPTEERL